LLVRSAGQETGDFGHIYADGVERSPNRRGYNLVAVSADGQVLDAANFDTHADPAANSQLAQWVAALPPGTQVAGAVRDEASLNLTQEGVDALRSLGVAGDLRGHFRWGHAFIGQKGDAAGTAREVLDGVRPVQLSLGLPISAAEVAAALDTVEVR
jgi:Interleukin-like EMT inducer